MKNPDIFKFKSVGKYLYQKFKYLKQEGYYSSKEEVSKLLGFSNRSGFYHLIYENVNIDLSKIRLYKKVFRLNDVEEKRLGLLACYVKADSPFEKKLFKDLLNQQR